MRRGCISLGNVRCDGCQRIITHAERYLAVDEEDGVEVEKGEKSFYCVDCSLQKGYTEYRGDRGEQKLTFFPMDIQSPEPDSEVQPPEADGQVKSPEADGQVKSPEPDSGETAGQKKDDE